jgi:hypothetical protein
MNPLNKVLHTVKGASPLLYAVVLLHFLAAIGCLLGLLLDDRLLMGVNVWIKPLKFAISDGIYILSFGYLITLYPYSASKKNAINQVVVWTLLIEIGIIIYQAFRGVKSHYNTSSAFDGLLFGVMGFLIAINVVVMVLLLIDTIRFQLHTSPAMQRAILLGWLIVIFGSWVGGQMIAQRSHNVGVADGGEGLPLLNWSTIGGDLRIAHFFGLHAIQVIPLFAFWLSKNWKATSKQQIMAITIFGFIYAAWIGFTFYQAKMGVPVF